MHLYFIGCEYAGKTTLANRILEWGKENMGGIRHFHDHMTVPCSELDPQAKDSYRAAHPQVKELLQRYMIQYHVGPEMYGDHPDTSHMGLAIEEAVYAPLYYGYGGENSGSPIRSPKGQRTEMARYVERMILQQAPQTVLVLLKASPQVIRQRMEASPHPAPDEPTRGVVQAKDIEYVLPRFEEEFQWSLLKNKITLDTTSATIEETFAEFLQKHEPYMTDADKKRKRALRSS